MLKRFLIILCIVVLSLPLYAFGDALPSDTPIIEQSTPIEPVEQTPIVDEPNDVIDIAIDELTFPDTVFREYVQKTFDTNKNGIISPGENMAVTRILVSNMGIESLKGVENFINLHMLSCDGNKIKNLDLSQLPTLSELWCNNNGMEVLNLSACSNLEKLRCSDNKLTELILSDCINLMEVSCVNNMLAKLDVSNCKQLSAIWCYKNRLLELDFSHCDKLEILSCYNNRLVKLHLPKISQLTDLWCYQNRLVELDLSTSLNIEKLDCSNNNLTSLDISKCNGLNRLNVSNNSLSYLDISKASFNLDESKFSPQNIKVALAADDNGKYSFNLIKLNPAPIMANVLANDRLVDGEVVGFDSPLKYTYTMTDLEGNTANMDVNLNFRLSPKAVKTENIKDKINLVSLMIIIVGLLLLIALVYFIRLKIKQKPKY